MSKLLLFILLLFGYAFAKAQSFKPHKAIQHQVTSKTLLVGCPSGPDGKFNKPLFDRLYKTNWTASEYIVSNRNDATMVYKSDRAKYFITGFFSKGDGGKNSTQHHMNFKMRGTSSILEIGLDRDITAVDYQYAIRVANDHFMNADQYEDKPITEAWTETNGKLLKKVKLLIPSENVNDSKRVLKAYKYAVDIVPQSEIDKAIKSNQEGVAVIYFNSQYSSYGFIYPMITVYHPATGKTLSFFEHKKPKAFNASLWQITPSIIKSIYKNSK